MNRMLRQSLAVGFLALSFFSNTGFSQDDTPAPVSRTIPGTALYRLPFQNEFSVVGSDGIFYRVRQNRPPLELPAVQSAVVPPLPASTLEAFNLDPNSNQPIDSIAFSGRASQLGIGRDNRLFLVVTILPDVIIARSDSFAPVPSPRSKLYIIPTPFPPRILNATLESLANTPVGAGTDAASEAVQSLNGIVEAEFEGAVHSLQVKQVGDQEYLYLSATVVSYRFPTLSGDPGAVPSVVPGPIKLIPKLVIFDSSGRKIKEVDSE